MSETTKNAGKNATKNQPKLVAPERARMLKGFDMLADDIRHSILERLAQQPTNVSDLCAALNEKQPSISHHLTLLKMAGIVDYSRDGKCNTYFIIKESLQELARIVTALAK